MTDIIVITLNSPERAWPPFMDWLRQQGIPPEDTRAITIDPDRMTCDIVRNKRRNGKFYAENDVVATEVQTDIPVTSLPPRR